MNYDNRGKCVIFNHTIFDENLNERRGTDVDAIRINNVFTKLGFEVLRYDDLTYMELKDRISTCTYIFLHFNICHCKKKRRMFSLPR